MLHHILALVPLPRLSVRNDRSPILPPRRSFHIQQHCVFRIVVGASPRIPPRVGYEVAIPGDTGNSGSLRGLGLMVLSRAAVARGSMLESRRPSAYLYAQLGPVRDREGRVAA